MRANRVTGILLVSVAIIGYFTVADDLRHTGELIGVSGVLLAGFVLLSNGYKLLPLSIKQSRLSACGILLGILIGAALDRMIIGVTLGLLIGIIIGGVLSKL